MGNAEKTMRPLLVLWAIDHTLTEDHGVNKETYAYAFELLTGRQATAASAPTHVRTELEILLNMLLIHGIKPTPLYVARMPEVLEAAAVANAAALRERGQELPGARDALTALHEINGIFQSVLSGKIKPNAIINLSAFNLDGYIDFEVGGYGSDAHARDKLVGFSRERASVKYGAHFDENNTVIIGSTRRDVRAGRNGGAHVVGVATGSESMDSLHSAGADIILPDLRDTHVVIGAVTGFAL